MSCVVTLALDDAAQECFERLRRTWFPTALNKIPAHVTLFHTLTERDETASLLEKCALAQSSFAIDVGEARSIGRGVAYFFTSDACFALHRRLRSAFEAELSAQDRQGFRPHIVVQNKVTPDEARSALLALQDAFVPSTVQAIGLDLWRYLDGPWQHLRRFSFS
jgi:2'-5' RNA ligase